MASCYLTERIKDLFKTSNGKYIAPQQVESLLLVDKFIDQVAVIADQRKFVSALVVPEFRLVEEWAREHHIAFTCREDLCANETGEEDAAWTASRFFNNTWPIMSRSSVSLSWLTTSLWSRAS